jgi:hypothetical protein
MEIVFCFNCNKNLQYGFGWGQEGWHGDLVTQLLLKAKGRGTSFV